MPDEIQPQAALAAAPPAATPGTGLTIQQSAQPSAPPVASESREAIIKKYETMYGQPPAPAEVVQPAPSSIPPPVAQPDLSAVVASLVAEINTLKSNAAKPVVAPPVTAAEEQDWLKMLAEGKRGEGEALLAKKVQSLMGENLQQQAVEKTLALIEAQNFANDIRAKNPDLMIMEQYITAAAAQRIEGAQRAGKIRTPADYVTVYKDAINTEVANARNIILTARGEGRQEGSARTAAVLASPSIAPNTVNTERETAQRPTEQPAQTASDYLAERAARSARQRGMVTG